MPSQGRGGVTPDFLTLFGRPPEVRAAAPGRVNLIGDHTDYNGGYVLPAVIPQRTEAQILRRGDDVIRVWSAQAGESGELCEYQLGHERRRGDWGDYVQGVTVVLHEAGHRVTGCDLRIDSAVPIGSGLSSSAALEVALLRALREAFALRIDDVALALLAQEAEVGFVGVPVGVMDQMAASLGEPGSALFLDTRSLQYERVPLLVGTELVVLHSGIVHRHASGQYVIRRRECEEAARLLGVGQLRDLEGLGRQEALERLHSLPEPLNRRARHVLLENERVLEAVEAIGAGNAEGLGRLLDASHESLREDYDASVPEIDLMVGLARRRDEVYGARMTGGGFGGSVVILCAGGCGPRVAAELARRYLDESGRRAEVLMPLGVSDPPASPSFPPGATGRSTRPRRRAL